MRNIRIQLKFVGTNYHGWQIQPNGVTVQQKLSEAVSSITNGDFSNLCGCGRTDAGVHAQKYFASFKTSSSISTSNIPLALNSKLPDDIVCVQAEEMPEEFDVSRDVTSKTYTYTIYNGEISDPFLFPFVYNVKFPLDVSKMHIAAKSFEGTHDFCGFAASGFTVKTTVRTIYSVDITKDDKIIQIKVCGNGFLYNMVRIIAGTLIAVGGGKIEPDQITDIINSKDRTRAGATAPAQGLCLTEVCYK